MSLLSTTAHNISSIEFGILSPEEIRAMAVCKINNKEMSGAQPGSVYDERMGCMGDSSEKCVTCGLGGRECWGHFGYIDLAEPILHPMFYKIISVFLKCFCKQCHRLLATPEQIELYGLGKIQGERRFNKIAERLKKTELCPHCSAPQPKITYKSKESIISMEYKQKTSSKNKEAKVSVNLTTEDIKKIFDDISTDDILLLGLNPDRIHPRSLVLTALPVIPPCSRPYIIADGNTCDDDLTYQLNEIVKINNKLVEETDDNKRQKLIQSLKFKISTTYNNSKGKSKHPTDSRPLKGLKERLTGKDGRLRGNLMGCGVCR